MMESLAFLKKTYNQLPKLHIITSRKTDLVYNFCTEFIVYYMIMVYKKNLAQEWLPGVFLQLLVLGWWLTSCKCQRSNQVGKWLHFYYYHLLLQIKIHLPGFQARMAHEVFLVMVVLMSGKNKQDSKELSPRSLESLFLRLKILVRLKHV